MGLAARIFLVFLPRHRQLRSLVSLPLITYDWVMTGLLGLTMLKLGVDRLLTQKFQVSSSRSDGQSSALEYSPFYHLTIVILVLV